MPNDMNIFNGPDLGSVIDAELTYLRSLGENENLAFAAANLSAFEALLIIMKHSDTGLPVYNAVSNVTTPFSGPSGILGRLRMMRSLGLLEERPGQKRSQVCLAPSEKLLNDLVPILYARHTGKNLI